MKSVRLFLLAVVVLAGVAVAAGPAQALLGFLSQYKEVTAENGFVTIPVAQVSDGKAHYFRFEDQGVELRFFVVKSSDNVIRAAFDACDVCFHAKKGYSQDKEFMVCNNCNMRFHSSRINEVEGGCNPSPLTRTVKGDSIVITTADLASGKKYF